MSIVRSDIQPEFPSSNFRRSVTRSHFGLEQNVAGEHNPGAITFPIESIK